MKLLTILLSFGFALCCDEGAQDIEAFADMESWPLYQAGDLNLRKLDSTDIRVQYEARFPDGSLASGKYVDTTMNLDVFKVFFHSKPAFWIQWSSVSNAHVADGAPAIDYLIVLQDNHQIVSRFAGQPGERTWMGSHQWVQFKPDQVVQVDIQEDGESKTKKMDTQVKFLDFAALPFYLPRLELRDGLQFRYRGFRYQDSTQVEPAIYVKGKTIFKDTSGVDHQVWEVQLTNPERSILCRFYISQSAPYFLGWDYRLLGNGKLITSMRYVKHTEF